MNIQPDHIHRLMTEKLAGTISEDDDLYLQGLITTNPLVQKEWERLVQLFDPSDIQTGFTRFDTKNWLPAAAITGQPVKRFRVHWVTIAAAIAGLTLLFITAWYLLKEKRPPAMLAQNRKSGVELRLANGQVVPLSSHTPTITLEGATLQTTEKSLTYSSGPTTPAGWNSLTVPTGMDYKIALSDGSEIWLNAGSQLRFPFQFTATRREIIVSGEAYLRVAQDATRPFFVTVPTTTEVASSIEVLGTEFNINAYDSTQLKVSLVTGAVKVKAAGQEVILQPGQEATATDHLVVHSFDADEVLGWRRGIYYFNQASLEQISTVLPRWFGVEVILDRPGIATDRFTGLVNRNKPISVFLDNLKSTMAVDYYFTTDSVLHFK